jgi:hypothetical protein
MGFQSRVLYRVQGAILATLPDVPVWEVRPAAWKNALGLKQTEKPTPWHYSGFDTPLWETWTQDAWDALGIALYARDLNAARIAKRLRETA